MGEVVELVHDEDKSKVEGIIALLEGLVEQYSEGKRKPQDIFIIAAEETATPGVVNYHRLSSCANFPAMEIGLLEIAKALVVKEVNE